MTNPPECDEDNDCDEILRRVERIAAQMEHERNAALIDDYNLYNRAYAKPEPGKKRRGAWFGHNDEFDRLKVALKKAIDEADAKNCFVPPEHRQKLYWQFPKKPLVPKI